MAPVTDDDITVTDGPVLAVPDEPAELQAGLRAALLDGADWREDLPEDLRIDTWLWDRWGPELGPAGCDREAFEAVVVSSRRELWLWLLGDRRWEQVVSGLAGRVRRRLPATAA